MELINRDELSRALHACLGQSSGDTPIVDHTLMAIIAAVEKMPAVDAVPVVRCKDCKHHHWDQDPCHGKTVHYCELPHMRGIEVFKEFLCYYGERRNNDTKR